MYDFAKKEDKMEMSVGSKIIMNTKHDLTSIAPNLKLTHQQRSYSYGLFRSFFWLLGLDCLLMVLFLSYSAYKSSSATVVQNMVELNLLVTEFWNFHAVMQCSLNSAIVWKDQATLMRTKPSRVYYEYSKHFKESIIPRFEALKSKDLGSFNTFYRNISTQDGLLCNLLRKVGKREYKGCGEGQAAFIDKNLIIFLKGLVAIMDQTADTLVMQTDSDNMAAQIMANPNFQVYQAYTLISRLTRDVYYIIMLPLGESLSTYISSKGQATSSGSSKTTSDLQTFCYIFIPSLLLYLFLTGMLFVRSFASTMYFYWNTLKIVPVGLMGRNALLANRMKKVESASAKLLAF